MPDPSSAGVLAKAQGIANNGVTQARSIARPAFHNSGISGFICAILLQIRAFVVASIQALINQFPFLTAQLQAIQAGAVAVINGLLAAFGCPVPSG